MENIWSYTAFNDNSWTGSMNHVGTERGAKIKAKRLAIENGFSHYTVGVLGHNNTKTYKIMVKS